MLVSVGGRRTFPEVEAKPRRTGTRLDVRRRIDARPAAVVAVAKMISIS